MGRYLTRDIETNRLIRRPYRRQVLGSQRHPQIIDIEPALANPVKHLDERLTVAHLQHKVRHEITNTIHVRIVLQRVLCSQHTFK